MSSAPKYGAVLTAIVLCALAAITQASAVTALPGQLADPPTEPFPKWSSDAKAVYAANVALSFYARLSEEDQLLLAGTIQSMVKRRRAALTRLIADAPQQALWLSLSPAQRDGLPKFVLDQLETRMHTLGDLLLSITEPLLPHLRTGQQQDAIVLDSAPAGDTVTTWAVSLDDESYEASVYGIRLGHQTKFDTPIHSISLDGVMAVSQRQLYRLDEVEAGAFGYGPDEIVVTDGGAQPIVLQDTAALDGLELALRERLLRFGPVPVPANENEWTNGLKRILVIKVTYRDDSRETPYSDADITAAITGASAFFRDNAQGRTAFDTRIVSGSLVLPSIALFNGTSNSDLGYRILGEEAINAARAFGHDPDSYDRIIVMTPQLYAIPEAKAIVGGNYVVVSSDVIGDLRTTFAHELGHTYGFQHSTFWDPDSTSDPSGPGMSLEYGDAWDMMGAADVDDTDLDPTRRHFNAFFKTLAGWLPAPDVADATSGGMFRLRRHDSASAVGLRAIYIDAGDGSFYWLGRRGQFPWNEPMREGVEIRRVRGYTGGGYEIVELLDMPQDGGTPGGTAAHSLRAPHQFLDDENGVWILVGAPGEDALGEYLPINIVRL